MRNGVQGRDLEDFVAAVHVSKRDKQLGHGIGLSSAEAGGEVLRKRLKATNTRRRWFMVDKW